MRLPGSKHDEVVRDASYTVVDVNGYGLVIDGTTGQYLTKGTPLTIDCISQQTVMVGDTLVNIIHWAHITGPQADAGEYIDPSALLKAHGTIDTTIPDCPPISATSNTMPNGNGVSSSNTVVNPTSIATNGNGG